MKKQVIACLLGGAVFIQPVFPMLSVQAEEVIKTNEAQKKEVVDKKPTNKEGYTEAINEKRISILNLDKDMMILKQEIEQLNEGLKKENDLRRKEKELNEKEAFLEERWLQFSDRLTIWQTEGTPEDNFINLLLGSESLTDMISRTFAFKTLLEADNAQISLLKDESKLLEQEKKDLAKELALLKAKKIEAVEKEKLLTETTAKMKKELSELEVKEVKRLQEEIKKQEERKKELLEMQLTSDSMKELRTLTKEMGEGVEFEATFIQPAEGRFTSPFGKRKNPEGGEEIQVHKGTDIANLVGTPIIASAEGVVVIALASSGGYGNYVTIQHEVNGETFYTVYAHMSVIGVEVGEKVRQGELVGLMGSTGRSTGPHLHFEIQNANKEAMDAMLYMGVKDKVKIVKKKKDAEKNKETEKDIEAKKNKK